MRQCCRARHVDLSQVLSSRESKMSRALRDYHAISAVTLHSHLSQITTSFLSRLLLLRLLQHLLHNLLLLNQERPHNSIPYAITASATAIRSSDSLLGVGCGSIFAGAERWDLNCVSLDLREGFGGGCKRERTPGSFVPQSPHFGAVPRFLMCRSRNLPPGVLITRVLLERVLYLYGKHG
jgi:hypothetical protein